MSVQSIAKVEMFDKTDQEMNDEYLVECYGVFTAETDYWFSGFEFICRGLAREQFLALKSQGIACDLVDAIHNETIDEFQP